MKKVGLVALGLVMYVVEGIDKVFEKAEQNGASWVMAYKVNKAREEKAKEAAKEDSI